MKKFLFALFTMMLSTNALSNGQTTTVKSIWLDDTGGGYAIFDAPVVLSGACASLASFAAFDTNTLGGQSFHKTLLAAQMTGKSVQIYLKDNCAPWQQNVREIKSIGIHLTFSSRISSTSKKKIPNSLPSSELAPILSGKDNF